MERSHLRVLARVRKTLRAMGELFAFLWAGASAIGSVLIGRVPEPATTPEPEKTAAVPATIADQT